MSWADDINDRGQVVGGSGTADYTTHAFLWERGTMKDLGTLGGVASAATAINERGQVTGYSYNAAGVMRAFLWERGVTRDIAAPGSGTGINKRGQIIGNLLAQLSGHGDQQGFFWKNGVTYDLGNLGWDENTAADVNDAGLVVGETGYSETGPYRGYLWRNARMHDLGSLFPGGNSQAVGINDRGQVAGRSWAATGRTHAMLWYRGTWKDLGTFGGTADYSTVNAVRWRACGAKLLCAAVAEHLASDLPMA